VIRWLGRWELLLFPENQGVDESVSKETIHSIHGPGNPRSAVHNRVNFRQTIPRKLSDEKVQAVHDSFVFIVGIVGMSKGSEGTKKNEKRTP